MRSEHLEMLVLVREILFVWHLCNVMFVMKHVVQCVMFSECRFFSPQKSLIRNPVNVLVVHSIEPGLQRV